MSTLLGVLAAGAVLALLGTIHWYLWRRLVRDLTRRGGVPRRVGTVLVVLLPLCFVGVQLSSGSGTPFVLHQALGWTGYLWGVLLVYLLLALLLTEPVRLLLTRRAARRATGAPVPTPRGPEAGDATVPEGDGERVAVTVPSDATTAPAGPSVPSARPTAGSGEPGPSAEAEPAAPEAPADPADPPTSGDAEPATELADRRRFLTRSLAVGAAVVAAGTVGYGLYNARQLRTLTATVPIVGLPPTAEGYRITVMSDLHAGPVIGRSFTELVVDAMNRTEPDLMVICGDLVDAGVDQLRSTVAPLADLRSRDGVYYVTGNHEYYVGAAPWVAHVRELGIVPLENERVQLGAGFDLAGIRDLEGERHGEPPDLAAALEGRDPDVPVVLLSHQPQIIHEAVDHGVDLTIAGHTHGGQVWPLTYLADLANPTLFGLERYGASQLYVTRGAGAWGPPVRVGADPDISVLTLTAA